MHNEFTPDEIEVGRLIFARPWEFIWASGRIDNLPPMHGIEIAFAGRSNVGKSSLINALTNQKALARTSDTPGRTQELIFFSGGGPLTLTDMPGYGFAKVSKEKVGAWTQLIHAYLRGRANLARVFVLIDARHGFKDVDQPLLDALDKAAVSYQIVLTKADAQTGKGLVEVMEKVQAGIARRPAAFPQVLATSSAKGIGIPDLRAQIVRLMAEKGALS
jgi:GTP-binding protein